MSQNQVEKNVWRTTDQEEADTLVRRGWKLVSAFPTKVGHTQDDEARTSEAQEITYVLMRESRIEQKA